MARDLSLKQFEKKLEQCGMSNALFGYIDIGCKQRISVYRFNAGDNRRAQLAYLLREQTRHGGRK